MSELLYQISLWILIIVAIVNLILSIFVYKSDAKSATNRIFILLGIVITFWLVTMYISLLTFSVTVNLVLIRLSLFWATLINCLFILLCCTIPDQKVKIKKNKLAILLSITFGVMFLTLTNLTFSGAIIHGDSITPTPGKAIFVFPLYIILTTSIIIWNLIGRIRASVGLLKKQLTLVLIGITAMLGLIVFTIVIPVAAFRNSSFVPFFPLYTLFFTSLSAYAIVKHNLFNIKVVATEAVTVIIWTILIAKLIVNRNSIELAFDSLILVVMVIFGVLLIRSVINEVIQRERLQELTNKLKALDAQKNEFISMAAHELRAPMTAIKGYISMIMQGDAGEISEKTRGFLVDTNSINDRLIRLVNNMLDVSRIEEGRIIFQLEEERLSNIVRAVYSEFMPEAARKDLEYKLVLPRDINDKVNVDVDRTNEVIGNFISNAIKYTDKGKVIISLKQPSNGTVRLEVEDTGPGISKQEQEKLFQKFYRVESNIGKTTGTGLGLYISKLIIERFGGKIGVISEPGKGSVFWFELPLKV